jgi:elongation factor G
VALYYDEASKASLSIFVRFPRHEDLVDEWRMNLVEAIAEEDESLLEKYLGGEELQPEEIMAASVRRPSA